MENLNQSELDAVNYASKKNLWLAIKNGQLRTMGRGEYLGRCVLRLFWKEAFSVCDKIAVLNRIGQLGQQLNTLKEDPKKTQKLQEFSASVGKLSTRVYGKLGLEILNLCNEQTKRSNTKKRKKEINQKLFDVQKKLENLKNQTQEFLELQKLLDKQDEERQVKERRESK